MNHEDRLKRFETIRREQLRVDPSHRLEIARRGCHSAGENQHQHQTELFEVALGIVREEQDQKREKKEQGKEEKKHDDITIDVSDNSLSGLEPLRSSKYRSHRYKCCCCEMDGAVINYGGKLTVGLCVLFFCFIQIHRSSEDFAAYMTLISAVLGVFISTPKMKHIKD